LIQNCSVDDKFLKLKFDERAEKGSLRSLRIVKSGIDFCSNDYLGIVKNNLLAKGHAQYLQTEKWHGSTGSRLLTGNYPLIEETEQLVATFHAAKAGLIFNSGYDANVGLLSCVPQRGDTILYDHLCHASIRDGIRLSFATAISFEHNDLMDLEKKIKAAKGKLFVVTESVFSMDGDIPPLKDLSVLCDRYEAALIADEAHSTGILGEKGEGLVQALGIENKTFARINTFGKALGCHGAIILGSTFLKEYLINFARTFIYTTALPASAVAAIKTSYGVFPMMKNERLHLKKLIIMFQEGTEGLSRIISQTAIQGVIFPGNAQVKKLAKQLQLSGLDVRPIIYPTVPKGKERLRIVLHSFNTEEEILLLIRALKSEVSSIGKEV